jgi:serine O-acetyltransferase
MERLDSHGVAGVQSNTLGDAMFNALKQDIRACMERDPAARSKLEVVLTYPGFHAVMAYRMAHPLWRRGFRLLARLLSYLARMITGIEIHPGAHIGRGFFIDHGLGVVIGETSEIGDNVTLYHDVTLGGIAPSVDSDQQRDVKRHPTLCDEVIVGSGAQILGPISVGKGARIGANSVVLHEVPAGATMVGIPAKQVRGRAARESREHPRFDAYGTRADVSDPTQRILDALLDRVQGLSMRVEELERQLVEQGVEDWDVDDDLGGEDDTYEEEPPFDPKRGG